MNPEQLQQKRLQAASQVDLSDLHDILQRSSALYVGDMHVLKSALGCLIIGRFYGWRVLRIILSPRAYRNYQEVLGVKFNEVCPDRGPLAEKSLGLYLTDQIGKFWKVVKGMIKVEGKTQLTQ